MTVHTWTMSTTSPRTSPRTSPPRRRANRPRTATESIAAGDLVEEWTDALLYSEIAPKCSRSAVILTGFRPESAHTTACLASVFSLHNETVNIWTHLVGAALFLGLLGSELAAGTTAPTSYRAFYCAVAGLCFVGSAAFHVLANHPRYYARAWIVDLGGMFALIGAGAGSHTYFSVGTSHGALVLYGHVALCVGCSALSFVLMAGMVARQAASGGAADETALRGMLPAVLVCASFSYWLLACSHVAILEDGATAWRCFWQLGPEWFTWGVGMMIWKLQVPEVWAPYRFDLFGASHQVHHVMCVACAWWHLQNIEQMQSWRPAAEAPALFNM